eukprot:2430452-Rhodomonas_salina.1
MLSLLSVQHNATARRFFTLHTPAKCPRVCTSSGPPTPACSEGGRGHCANGVGYLFVGHVVVGYGRCQ